MATFRGLEGLMVLGGYLIGTPLVDGAIAPGATTMSLYGFPLEGVSGPGDIFIVDGNVYTVTSPFTATANNTLPAITFTPGAQGAGFADGAVVTYATNTILNTRNWSLTPSLAVLDSTVQQQRWGTCRSGLAMWTGRFEALLDLTDPQQAALMTHLTGPTPLTTSVALFFGVEAGEARGFYGMAIVSSDTIASPLRDLVTLTIDFAGDGFVARHWGNASTCVAVPPALASSLTICLDLEEASSTRFDSVGSTDLASLNGVTRRPGLGAGYAAHFVGSAWQSLSTPATADSDLTSPFTLAFWVTPGALPAAQSALLSQGATTSAGQYEWLVLLLSTGKLLVSIGGAGAGVIAASTAVLTPESPAFVMVWHDGTTLRLQINNGVIDSALGSTFTSGSVVPFCIGAIGHTSAADHSAARQFFTGDIDSVMFFDTPLTDQADRDLLWNGGLGVRCTCP